MWNSAEQQLMRMGGLVLHLVAPWLPVIVSVLIALLSIRVITERLVIRSRQWWVVVPSKTHAPDLDQIRAVWASTGRSAHRPIFGWFTRRVDTIIVSQRLDSLQRMIFVIGGPKRAAGGLSAALHSFGSTIASRALTSTVLPWNALNPPNGATLEDRPSARRALAPSPAIVIPDEPERDQGDEPHITDDGATQGDAPAFMPYVAPDVEPDRETTARVLAGYASADDTVLQPDITKLDEFTEDSPGVDDSTTGDDLDTDESELADPEPAWLPPRLYRRRRYLTIDGRHADSLRILTEFSAVANQLAATLTTMNTSIGEDATVDVHLSPVPYRVADRYRRRQVAPEIEAKRTGGRAGFAGELASALRQEAAAVVTAASPRATTTVSTIDPLTALTGVNEIVRSELTHDRSRLVASETLFYVRIMVTVQAVERKRADNKVNALVQALSPLASEAHIKQRWFTNLFGNAHHFDRLLTTARMRRNAHPVSAAELASLLTPAPGGASHPSIRRGAAVPAVGLDVPEYVPGETPHLLPGLRATTTDGREIITGKPLSGLVHSYTAGASGSGKTTSMLVEDIAIARDTRWGVGLFDPQGPAIEKMLPYLTDVEKPIYLVDLRRRMQLSFAPIDMSYRSPDEADTIVTSLGDAVANAMMWNDRTVRARTLTDQALHLLTHTNSLLCADGYPELQNTPLDIARVVDNEAFRMSLLNHAPDAMQEYWLERFPKLPKDAHPVVTNLWDLLPGYHSPRGTLLGQAQGTYNARQVLDEGGILLLCAGGIGGHARLIANLFIFDLFRESLGRHREHPFWLDADEAQVLDSSASGYMAAALELQRQWLMKINFRNQSPAALSPRTLDALFTNRSCVRTGPVAFKDAAVLAREARVPTEAVQDLDPRQWIEQNNTETRKGSAYLGKGLSPEELWTPNYAGVPDLVRRIHADTKAVTRDQIAVTLAERPKLLTGYLDAKHRRRNHTERREPATAGGFPNRKK